MTSGAGFAPAGLLAGEDEVLEERDVVSQSGTHHVRLPLRGLADVDPERHSRASQHPAQPHELVFGERVHRIDDDGVDAGRRPLVPEREAPADDGVEEAFCLAGPGAGGDEGRPTLGNRADSAFLVAVEMRDLPRDPLAQMRMKQPFGDQRSHRRALSEWPRQADVRPLEQWRLSSFVEGEKLPHLRVQVRVGEGERGELVAQEAADDVLGVGDGVQGLGTRLTPSRRRWPAARPSPTD